MCDGQYIIIYNLGWLPLSGTSETCTTDLPHTFRWCKSSNACGISLMPLYCFAYCTGLIWPAVTIAINSSQTARAWAGKLRLCSPNLCERLVSVTQKCAQGL